MVTLLRHPKQGSSLVTLDKQALKVEEVVRKALGGVLFIDEAYSLSSEGCGGYGTEAIETLLKMMEDHREELIVIVAGYTDKMTEFLASNPGLASRFNKQLYFKDYSPLSLLEIFKLFCSQNEFVLSQGAEERLIELLSAYFRKRDDTFGNARLARNIFEETISNQANRIIAIPNVDTTMLSTIETVDSPVPVGELIPELVAV